MELGRQINTVAERTPYEVFAGESIKQEIHIVHVENIFTMIEAEKYLEVNGFSKRKKTIHRYQ